MSKRSGNCYNPASVLTQEAIHLQSFSPERREATEVRASERMEVTKNTCLLYQRAQHFQLLLSRQHTILCFRPQEGAGEGK